MTVAGALNPRPPHPVLFGVEEPEQLSRLTTFFRVFLAIPQLIVVSLLSYAVAIISIIAWFAVLFTGRYPRGLFDFAVGVMRWQANVGAYGALLRDEYPPFSMDAGQYPVVFDVPYPERLSRWKLFVRIFTVIPNQIVFAFVEIAWLFASIFAWLAILIGGKYPHRLFGFSVGTLRWQSRQLAYTYLLTDAYPPYGLRSEAPPGNELVSGIIGLPIFVCYVALYIFVISVYARGGTDTISVRVPLSSPALAQAAPSGSAGGVRITLRGYDDRVPSARGHLPDVGYRFVSFDFLAEKDAFYPTFFTATLFRMHDCLGDLYSPEEVSSGSEFEFFFRGGHNKGTVYFQVPIGLRPCDLIYQPGARKVRFVFLGGA